MNIFLAILNNCNCHRADRWSVQWGMGRVVPKGQLLQPTLWESQGVFPSSRLLSRSWNCTLVYTCSCRFSVTGVNHTISSNSASLALVQQAHRRWPLWHSEFDTTLPPISCNLKKKRQSVKIGVKQLHQSYWQRQKGNGKDKYWERLQKVKELKRYHQHSLSPGKMAK